MNKNFSFTHNINMVFLLVFEILLILFFMPIRFDVNLRFSLDRKINFMIVEFAGLKLVKIKSVFDENCLKSTLNGKNILGKLKKNFKKDKISKAFGCLVKDNAIKITNIYGVIGGDDANAVATNCGSVLSLFSAVSPKANTSAVFPYFDGNKFEIGVKISFSVSLNLAVKAVSV
ncbi:MAG: hypothetical protein MJ193_02845 [Clostridia bacterium]|nr:hypothetical protein [Clostridia bacterium]